MPLSADILLDRLNLKNQIRRWRALAIIALVAAAVIVLERHAPGSPIEGDYVARVTIEGIMQDDPDLDDLFAELKDDKHVKAVILRLDTPGGTAVGGEETFLRLRAIAEKKPVVAVMRTMATSAGYMAALGADRIYAREGTITGSIGVMMESVEITDLAQKLGITPITIKSAPLKAVPSPLEKLTPEGRQSVQDLIDDFYGVFVNMVMQRRQLPKTLVMKVADGRVFTGRQALDAKLIDAIGGEEEAFDWLVKERKVKDTLEIQDVEPARDPENFLKEWATAMGSGLVPDLKGKLDGLVAIWHPSLK